MSKPKVGFSLFFISLLSAAIILSVYIIQSNRRPSTSLASCIENETRCVFEGGNSSIEKCISGKFVNFEKCNSGLKCFEDVDSAKCL